MSMDDAGPTFALVHRWYNMYIGVMRQELLKTVNDYAYGNLPYDEAVECLSETIGKWCAGFCLGLTGVSDRFVIEFVSWSSLCTIALQVLFDAFENCELSRDTFDFKHVVNELDTHLGNVQSRFGTEIIRHLESVYKDRLKIDNAARRVDNALWAILKGLLDGSVSKSRF